MLPAYIQYKLKAKQRHGVHSPFVYQLVENVLLSKGANRTGEIEALRKVLLKNHTEITCTDLGAGSKVMKGKVRRISKIAASSSTSKLHAAMLQRLIGYLNYVNVIELGTNLGLTSAYLAAAKNHPTLTTIEGDPALHKLATENLKSLNLKVSAICASFEEGLPAVLRSMKNIDFAYIDGNHMFEPTLSYFDRIANRINDGGAVAIGDIHWSGEMENAWKTICEKPGNLIFIDLFHLGLVFFRKGQAREHFTLKFP